MRIRHGLIISIIASALVLLAVAGFIGAMIDALNHPNSDLLLPLPMQAAMGLLLGLIFWFGGAGLIAWSTTWIIYSTVTAITSVLLLWASNIAATGNPSPATLIDDCVSLIFGSNNNYKQLKDIVKYAYNY